MAKKMIKVKLVRSPIGNPKTLQAHLKGLGLGKLNSTKELADTPSVRGMIFKVNHLVSVEEVSGK